MEAWLQLHLLQLASQDIASEQCNMFGRCGATKCHGTHRAPRSAKGLMLHANHVGQPPHASSKLISSVILGLQGKRVLTSCIQDEGTTNSPTLLRGHHWGSRAHTWGLSFRAFQTFNCCCDSQSACRGIRGRPQDTACVYACVVKQRHPWHHTYLNA